MSKLKYHNLIGRLFEVYNDMFLTLPLDQIKGTGLSLPLLFEKCKRELEKENSPESILNKHLKDITSSSKEAKDILFKYVQYIERQVVIVDALEDAFFEKLNDFNGKESLDGILRKIAQRDLNKKLIKIFNDGLHVRVVLTAHPTQFYPNTALSIITDLAKSIQEEDLKTLHGLLHQLGLTPFFQEKKPTPLEEANRQSWYLENIFYYAIPNLVLKIISKTEISFEKATELFSVGFWPGGDRDGNPSVDTSTTLHTARMLRLTLFRCYRRSIRKLRRRITFKGLESELMQLQYKVNDAILDIDSNRFDHIYFLKKIKSIKKQVENNFGGLHADEISKLEIAVSVFGSHFASLDIRQDSRIIKKAADLLGLPRSIDDMINFKGKLSMPDHAESTFSDVWNIFNVINEIQNLNGQRGCNRFIISNCKSAEDVIRIYIIAKHALKNCLINIDFVPLFETVEDLRNATKQISYLLKNTIYSTHLLSRKNVQNIMLGFSDGTKDGGYLKANWSIHQAKVNISSICNKENIKVVFFDGRGGPPARGGGNTHKFYSSLGPEVITNEIQTTIQGQTISSNFGTIQSASYNLELLLTAGIHHQLIIDKSYKWNEVQTNLMNKLADTSYLKYKSLKNHPRFMEYLSEYSTLKYYGLTNIASRPTSRNNNSKLNLDDLRAIPFVSSWSQLKQTVPGFFGIGTALNEIAKNGGLNDLMDLYNKQPLFSALIDNSMQSMLKCNFELTCYLRNNSKFSEFWKIIYDEYNLSKLMILKISSQSKLMEKDSCIASSIELRESLILPLLVIQHSCLQWLNGIGSPPADRSTIEKLLIRTMFGIINAGRNTV